MMKHLDIINKFKIEYDKADNASSYPSLTKYEIETILDKAYLALIAQKFTGNNVRQAYFEADSKAIEDIRPLITRSVCESYQSAATCSNDCVYLLPDEFLYYIQSFIAFNDIKSIDKKQHVKEPVRLVSHEDAYKFMNTTTNLPWIDKPVCFVEDSELHVLVDTYIHKTAPKELEVVYLKQPVKFVGGEDDDVFELNDTMAEELINLAIVMALENVESPRLTTKIQTRQLEA